MPHVVLQELRAGLFSKSYGLKGVREIMSMEGQRKIETYGRWYSSMPWRDGRLMARIESVIHVAEARPCQTGEDGGGRGGVKVRRRARYQRIYVEP